MPSLTSLPVEILEHIAFYVAADPLPGPPSHLPAFLLISRPFHASFNLAKKPSLYARIFRAKFDADPLYRRLPGTNARRLAEELVRRCLALRRLKLNTSQAEDESTLLADLWLAFLMFLENDGNNGRQLVEYARLDRWALDYVKLGGRLHHGRAENEGWIVGSEVNALALWLFWYTDAERVMTESHADRVKICEALGCIYAGSFKYPSQYAPLTTYNPVTNPPAAHPNANNPSILPFSYHPLPAPRRLTYPGTSPSPSCTLHVSPPPPVPPVILAYTSRQELSALKWPLQDNGVPMGSDAPGTRREARERDPPYVGPTGEDYLWVRGLRIGKVPWRVEEGDDDEETQGDYEVVMERRGGGMSWRHEGDWRRTVGCVVPRAPDSSPPDAPPSYTPSTLTGLWEGKYFGPDTDTFHTLLTQAHVHEPVPEDLHFYHWQTPLRIRIKEHLSFDASADARLGVDESGAGALGAWVEGGVGGAEFVEKRDTLLIHADPPTAPARTVEYKTCERDMDRALNDAWRDATGGDGDGDRDASDAPFGRGVYDVVLTAETDDWFSEAWPNERFIGRVRPWDGLVVLVRKAAPGGALGRWIFRGYLHSGINLVGRWRETATQVDAPGYEGTWCLAKKRE